MAAAKLPYIVTMTPYRDRPSYEFMISMFVLMSQHQVGHIPLRRHLPDQAREAGAEKFLRGDGEYLLMMDDDQEFPAGFAERLHSRGKKIIAGLYFLKAPPYAPMFYRHVGLLLDWQEHKWCPVIKLHMRDGSYRFGIHDGLRWHATGESFDQEPSWKALPQDIIALAQEVGDEEASLGIAEQLEWLRSLGPYTANVYMPLWGEVGSYLAKNTTEEYIREGAVLLPPEDAVIEVDAAGTGCMMIHREVFETVSRPWFSYREGGTEDMFFCRKAQEAGFEVYGDRSVVCGHAGTNHLHYLRAHARNIEEYVEQREGYAEQQEELGGC